MIENVLVKVGKFVLPVDFIILDMEEDDSVAIILGRPFLATGKAQINVQEGVLKLRVQGDEITFHVFQPMKHLDDDPNEDILELHYTVILQGDAKNFHYTKRHREGQGHGRKSTSSTLSNVCEHYREMRQHSQFLLKFEH